MKITIHIGVPKTGSTAIQAHLGLNRGWFERHGYAVPQVGWSEGYGHVHLFEDKTDDHLIRLREEISQFSDKGFRHAILSWEGLNMYGVNKIKNVLSFLEGHDVRVLAYLREQSEVVQSGYLQAVKQWRQRRSMEDIANSPRMLTPPHIDYSKLLGRYERVMGAEKLDVRVYERGLLHKKNVVLDFLQAVGLEDDEDFILAETEQNVSIDAGSAYILNALDPIFSEDEGRATLVDLLLCRIDDQGRDQKYFLSADRVQLIRDHYQQSNQEVLRKYVKQDLGRDLLFSEQKITSTDAESFEALAAQKLHFLYEMKDYRSWGGEALDPGSLNTITSPAQGWSPPEKYGVWSRGDQSTLRFRICPTRTTPYAETMRLSIQGAYFADNGSTVVSLPGGEEQRIDLRDATLEIPLIELDPYRRIDIVLRHDHPATPASLGQGDDERALSFSIQKAQYCVI